MLCEAAWSLCLPVIRPSSSSAKPPKSSPVRSVGALFILLAVVFFLLLLLLIHLAAASQHPTSNRKGVGHVFFFSLFFSINRSHTHWAERFGRAAHSLLKHLKGARQWALGHCEWTKTGVAVLNYTVAPVGQSWPIYNLLNQTYLAY